MSTLVLIPARGGSKRLPGKNLRTVGGVSLVGHATRCGVEYAQQHWEACRVICDTDSEEIAEEAKRHGAEVPFLREPDFAQDGTTSAATVIRMLERLGADDWDVVTLLQPTSPLRTAEDVRGTRGAWGEMMGVTTFSATTGSSVPNGAVYVIWAIELRRERSFTGGWGSRYAMPPERSIDINTAEDLAEAERLWRLQHG